jgi:anti-anti-sigma factor
MSSARIDMDGLNATYRLEGKELVVELVGNADHRTSEQMRDLCARLHTAALAANVTAAVIDLRRLEFMNSSCFKALVTWVSDIQDLEPAKRYKIRAFSNPGIPWQKRSLQSLQYFAVDLVTVEYPPSPAS